MDSSGLSFSPKKGFDVDFLQERPLGKSRHRPASIGIPAEKNIYLPTITEFVWHPIAHSLYPPEIAPSDYHLIRSLEIYLREKKIDNLSLQIEFLTSPKFWMQGMNNLSPIQARRVDSHRRPWTLTTLGKKRIADRRGLMEEWDDGGKASHRISHSLNETQERELLLHTRILCDRTDRQIAETYFQCANFIPPQSDETRRAHPTESFLRYARVALSPPSKRYQDEPPGAEALVRTDGSRRRPPSASANYYGRALRPQSLIWVITIFRLKLAPESGLCLSRAFKVKDFGN
ncbi:hypothetical protein EVAR_46425_1 [Eumeta japonica]|uniref:Mariner Mos1 transposase n=1 Tax=Eumeta variegata TaxID=151549 RepID=A0A4C1XGI9_EUMVA|nr:hypothetical protein EVAR_46425_1 [Eumeta japonica]